MADEYLTGDGNGSPDDVLRVVEEVARIDIRKVDRGGVRVATVTETAVEAVPVRLTDEVVDVTRVPVDRVVDEARASWIEQDGADEVTVVPVYAERAVVRTELVLLEEVRIRRRRVTRDETLTIDLRRQTAEIEPLPPNPVEETTL